LLAARTTGEIKMRTAMMQVLVRKTLIDLGKYGYKDEKVLWPVQSCIRIRRTSPRMFAGNFGSPRRLSIRKMSE
jgi:hypothetical protein